MKTILNEQIKRAKSLMGINEAVAPSSNILKAFFKDVTQDQIDNIFNKIEAKVGGLTGSNSLTSLMSAISSRKITKKYAVEVIIDTLQWADDEVATIIEKNAPDIVSSLENAAKSKTTKSEILAEVPELADLPDGVINSLFKKAAIEIGDEINVRKLIAMFSTEYPELFKKTWFKSLKNEEALLNVINQATQQFKGKNLQVVTSDIKKLLSDADSKLAELVKKKKITPEDKTLLEKVLSSTWGLVNPVHYKVLHPEKMDPWKTGGHIVGQIAVGYSLYALIKGWYETGSPFVGGAAAAQSEYGKIRRFTGSTGSEEDLRNFLMRTLNYSKEQAKQLNIKYIGDMKYQVSANNVVLIYKYQEDGTYKPE